jgi:hypothetical protein
MSVISHQSQNREVPCSIGVYDKDLYKTLRIGYEMSRGQQIKEEFGVKSGRPIKSIDAEITQEDIHWLVKAFIHNDDDNDRYVKK